jgi:hypothetical protein
MKTRAERRAVYSIERRGMRSGAWPAWEHTRFPSGLPMAVTGGWCRDVREVWTNGVYVVLGRPLANGVTHLAIRTASSLEPPWRDLQRIKNELFGEARFAVQVCPPQARLVDEADMYHLWIMPPGFEPRFGLHPDDEGRG